MYEVESSEVHETYTDDIEEVIADDFLKTISINGDCGVETNLNTFMNNFHSGMPVENEVLPSHNKRRLIKVFQGKPLIEILGSNHSSDFTHSDKYLLNPIDNLFNQIDCCIKDLNISLENLFELQEKVEIAIIKGEVIGIKEASYMLNFYIYPIYREMRKRGYTHQDLAG